MTEEASEAVIEAAEAEDEAAIEAAEEEREEALAEVECEEAPRCSCRRIVSQECTWGRAPTTTC